MPQNTSANETKGFVGGFCKENIFGYDYMYDIYMYILISIGAKCDILPVFKYDSFTH